MLRPPTQVRRLISLTSQDTAIDELLTGEENLLMMGRLGISVAPKRGHAGASC